ncbi:MAG: hypothetical protein IBX69_18460 [Anaerolineales bacterium]|nr:hypothetical protein [Anaerolineales bacterium]
MAGFERLFDSIALDFGLIQIRMGIKEKGYSRARKLTGRLREENQE